MNSSSIVHTLLMEAMRDGAPVAGSAVGRAGSVDRGSAVQLSALSVEGRFRGVRYQVFGGPDLIAACEYAARALEGQPIETAGVRALELAPALGLQRQSLSELLLIEDAFTALVGDLIDNQPGDQAGNPVGDSLANTEQAKDPGR